MFFFSPSLLYFLLRFCDFVIVIGTCKDRGVNNGVEINWGREMEKPPMRIRVGILFVLASWIEM